MNEKTDDEDEDEQATENKPKLDHTNEYSQNLESPLFQVGGRYAAIANTQSTAHIPQMIHDFQLDDPVLFKLYLESGSNNASSFPVASKPIKLSIPYQTTLSRLKSKFKKLQKEAAKQNEEQPLPVIITSAPTLAMLRFHQNDS